MRWDGQRVDANDLVRPQLPGIPRVSSLVRTVTTPEFAGITFHEVLAKSALNKVPGAAAVPFDWTINPYRGCSHACTYCFARRTHSYLELDTGADFDSQIVVKVNVVDVLRRELARPSWSQSPVALGTNTDPYQRAEGRYRLMPGISRALADSGTPFSILTKGTTLRRDLPLLADLSGSVRIGVGVSLALDDETIHADLEPGTPTPRARLALVRAIVDAGLPCQVLVAPVLPLITDSDEQLDRLLGQIADAGATSATAFALHLRPGAREWFWAYLTRSHPELLGAYSELYAGGAYVLRSYAADLARRVRPLLRRHRLAGLPVPRDVTDATPAHTDRATEPTLF
ncbi:MAG TPA: Rv2578c family radical SAM protein [Microlunatus sp.]|nr:Rv2578c family radical SAM protein [Microlunatus sp.]